MKLKNYKTATVVSLISVIIILIMSIVFVFIVDFFYKKEALDVAREKAELMLDNNLSIHDYFNKNLKPELLKKLKDTLKEGNHYEPSWMSSSVAVRKLNDYFLQRNNYGYYYKDAAANAINADNKADSFENDYLDRLNKNPNLNDEEGIITINDTDYYYLLKKDETTASQYLTGESGSDSATTEPDSEYSAENNLSSVVSIRIPLNQAYERSRHTLLIINLIMLILFAGLVITFLLFQHRLIFSPIKFLQKKSSAIASDNSLLGETIQLNTTKELSDFVAAFNSMSQKLYENQHMLEEKVKEKTIDLEDKIKEVNQLNADKDVFISILAHDLKSPLNALLGFSELLAMKAGRYSTDKIEKHAGIINNTAKQMFDLLEGILLWTRSQSGKLPFNPMEVNLLSTCNSVIEALQIVADTKSITIDCKIDQQITVFADLDMLKTVIRNLLSNALKFTNENGLISVNATKNDQNTLVSVTDNGIGMNDEQLQRLFKNPGHSVQDGTAGEHGTGLGLVLCKEFIEKHNGEISVESKLGSGTTFSFTLP